MRACVVDNVEACSVEFDCMKESETEAESYRKTQSGRKIYRMEREREGARKKSLLL